MSNTSDLGGGMLDRLSNDLLLEIVDLVRLRDLSRLVRTSRRLYEQLNEYLWRTGMKRDGRPLQYACKKYGRDDIITHLLSHFDQDEHDSILSHRFRYEYDCNARKKTPLLLAIRNSNLSVVKVLLDHGADVHQPETSKNAQSPFISAQPIHVVLDRHQQPWLQFEILELLIERGADVNARLATRNSQGVYTPLHLTMLHALEPRVIRLLLHHGANPTDLCDMNMNYVAGRFAQGTQSSFSLFLQLYEDLTDDLYEVVISFVKAGAQHHTTSVNSMLLDCLRPHEDERWVNIIDMLLKSGADPRMTNDDGDPCLVHFIQQHLEWRPKWNYRAIYAGSREDAIRYERVRQVSIRIIDLFTKAGVTINDCSFEEDSNRRTPWMVAAGLQPEFEDLFIDIIHLGVNANARDANGATAFHVMFMDSGHAQKSRIATLVAIGCNINAKDRDGNTLLHKAALSGMIADSWLPELMKYNFEPLAKNRAGQTFIDILCFYPATPFIPERYDQVLDDYLRQEVDNCRKNTTKPKILSKFPKGYHGPNQSHPRTRGRGPRL